MATAPAPAKRSPAELTRRCLLQTAASGSASTLALLLGLPGCAAFDGAGTRARVVVVGGGFGGATAAKYIRLLSDYKVDVVLVEPLAAFVSCPHV